MLAKIGFVAILSKQWRACKFEEEVIFALRTGDQLELFHEGDGSQLAQGQQMNGTGELLIREPID